MSLGEFELIRRFFTEQPVRRTETVLGVGDDCALLRVGDGEELAVTVDTMVAGVHFFADMCPASLGHKALAVNLSDLAAMGAEPRWATLALTLPESDENWLARFADGFFDLARRYGVELIGGDTTRGPLAITVQAMGVVPAGEGLRRCGARPGDRIYLTGPVGSAGLGLAIRSGRWAPEDAAASDRFERPEPRVKHGLRLRGLASACIDVSDGLAADLGHILTASGTGATVRFEALPLSEAVRRYVAESGDWRMPLTAGDDYELCFTVPTADSEELERRLFADGLFVAPIGHIETRAGLRVSRDGREAEFAPAGFQHFAAGH